jgi:hypothetical protein
MLEAFQRWVKRFGVRPWEDDLQKAFEAGYRAGMKHDETMKGRNRSPNPRPVKGKRSKHSTKPIKPRVDKLLERLKGEQR